MRVNVDDPPFNGNLQKAIDAVHLAHGGEVYVPAGPRHLTEPLNFRGKRYVRLVGDGHSDITDDDPHGTILNVNGAMAGQPVIDFTGAVGCGIERCQVYAAPMLAKPPACGLLLGRERTGDASGEHVLRELMVFGNFTRACVVNAGGDACRWYDCHFLQLGAHAGDGLKYTRRACYHAGPDAAAGLISPHGPLPLTSEMNSPDASVSDQAFSNCAFTMATSGLPDSALILLEPSTSHHRFNGCTGSALSADYRDRSRGCAAAIRIGRWPGDSGGDALQDAPPGPPASPAAHAVTCISIVEGLWETKGAAHFLEVREGTPVRGLRIVGAELRARQSAIKLNSPLRDSVIAHNLIECGFAEYEWVDEPPWRSVLHLAGVDASACSFDLRSAALPQPAGELGRRFTPHMALLVTGGGRLQNCDVATLDPAHVHIF